VSVVIPALDEAATVGAVVASLEPLRVRGTDGTALVDEVVVVDGGSRDQTVAHAEAAGARVTRQPDAGHTGKGEALRHGVQVTDGDVVAFLDADVLDPRPELVLGTIGPLLEDAQVRLCKAAYRRPWSGTAGSAGSLTDGGGGGGRVTALLVRPLLAVAWPELADLVQPLAGEYAADRQLLAALTFEGGYGVELGILLDTLRLHGRSAITQTDVGERRHDHQSLEALGRMATEILLVAADRLRREGRDLGDGTSAVLDGEALTRQPLAALAALPALHPESARATADDQPDGPRQGC
jgi:glucosyl-3-phosphoglycerate synthase